MDLRVRVDADAFLNEQALWKTSDNGASVEIAQRNSLQNHDLMSRGENWFMTVATDIVFHDLMSRGVNTCCDVN